MKRVSDLTKVDWIRIWDMNIYEFLNYCNFDIEYKKEEERAINDWKRSH